MSARPCDVTQRHDVRTIWLSRDHEEEDAILEYNPHIWDFLESSTNQESGLIDDCDLQASWLWG